MDIELTIPQATLTPTNISRAASAQDGSQVGHSEKGPKLVPRSPERRPAQRRGRTIRSGTIDFRALEGGKDAVSDYWYSGAEIRYPPPDHGDSWEACDEIAQRMDESRCDAWKDEVDKLLIFAGLFSAVVTAFTIEAYKALQADSSTTTAQILAVMAQQQLNNNSNTALSQQLSSILSRTQNFKPQPYAIRINIMWFLSLSFSLTTAMVGIACMQWLREYQRDSSLPHMETFGLTQMRREGLEKWRVPTILSALPLFLQAALVLFFIGLLDFLWYYDHEVAVVVSVFVGITFLFLAATTVLPAFQFLFHGSYRLRVPQCPYKSPQAWAFCRLGFHLFSFFSYVMPEPKFLFDGATPYIFSDWMQWRHRFARGKHALKFSYWHHFDKYWYDNRVRQAHTTHGDQPVEPDSDFIEGLENLAETLVPESPVFYHVLQCMRTSPVETNRLGPALKRIVGDQHTRYSAVERLSIAQAKDAIGILSLKYLPDPASRISAEAIQSHWELAIRINNTVLDEEAIMEFLPQTSLENMRKVLISEDVIYQAFMCIGRLARIDRDLKYGIDNMFGLLVTALARTTLFSDHYNKAMVDRVCDAMFDTCFHIEQWSGQRKLTDVRAMFKCASWIVNAFANPVVDEAVVSRWRRLPGYEKLVSLIRMLDDLSTEETFAKRVLGNDSAWSSVRRKFLE